MIKVNTICPFAVPKEYYYCVCFQALTLIRLSRLYLAGHHINLCPSYTNAANPPYPSFCSSSAYSNSYVNLAIFKDSTDRPRLASLTESEQLIHLFCNVPR
jgi:hypothetical protein